MRLIEQTHDQDTLDTAGGNSRAIESDETEDGELFDSFEE